jgi:hypothetical protein
VLCSKAGELVEAIKHYRRQELLRRPRPALGDGSWECTPEENMTGLAQCRELLGKGP